jgi:hypothetical protein
VDANRYVEILDQIRAQHGWSWSELAGRIDIREALSNPPVPYIQQAGASSSYLDNEEIIEAEIIDPPGPGVNPLAVVVDVTMNGSVGRADVYRPFYDEKDALGRTVHFCPFTGIQLLRSCKQCGSSLPRNSNDHTRFCGMCGSELPISVSMSDIQLHNYWVIYRMDHSVVHMKQFKNYSPFHPARQILTSLSPTLKLTMNGRPAELSIVWRGAARVQHAAA